VENNNFTSWLQCIEEKGAVQVVLFYKLVTTPVENDVVHQTFVCPLASLHDIFYDFVDTTSFQLFVIAQYKNDPLKILWCFPVDLSYIAYKCRLGTYFDTKRVSSEYLLTTLLIISTCAQVVFENMLQLA
jgi:hypothetical protein